MIAITGQLFAIFIVLCWIIAPALNRIARAIEALAPPTITTELPKLVTENDISEAIAKYYAERNTK